MRAVGDIAATNRDRFITAIRIRHARDRGDRGF